MKLISKVLYEMIFEPDNMLRVRNTVKDTWQRSHIYIHYAAERVGDDLDGAMEPLKLEPGRTAQVLTLEQFSLSLSVLGMIGSCTDLIRNDLELIYAPFIDPGYSAGVLTMAIRNSSSELRTIKPNQRIGKVCFFDVSESHLLMEEAIQLREDEVKVRISERLLDAAIKDD